MNNRLGAGRIGACVNAILTVSLSLGSAAAHADAEAVPTLADITVTGLPLQSNLPTSLGANSAGYSAKELEAQVNVIDTSDIVKYSPDTMTRKRYIGDRNAIIETRTASVTTSAHSLVYADGILISNLLGNGYAYPSRWNMVMPEELKRVDFFFGPFSAAYGGSSVGTTVLMTTSMPKELTIAAKVQAFSESFNYLGHSGHYQGSSESAMIGDRTTFGLSWLLGVDHLESHGHPMTYAVLGAPTTCTGACIANTPVVTGATSYVDPYGKPQLAIGGQSLDHTLQDTFKFKLEQSWDAVTVRYTLGSWRNHSDNQAQSWLTDGAGNPVSYSSTGKIALDGKYYSLGTAFAQNAWTQTHWLHAVSLSHGSGPLQWELVGSRYQIKDDVQRSSLPQGTKVGATTYFGQVTRNPYGDGWNVVDARGLWKAGAHQTFSFGAHYDRYTLDTRVDYSVTSNDGSWHDSVTPLLQKQASTGETSTRAWYVQDAISMSDHWRAIAGVRGERWTAQGGSNASLINGSLSRVQYGDKSLQKTSPKLSIESDLGAHWTARLSTGRAYRFPTVTELYQAISGTNSLVTNNPDLRPEQATTTELTLSRPISGGLVRASVFEERLEDALYSQTTAIPGVGNKTAVSNIDRVRTHGAELAIQKIDAFVDGLDLTGNVTYALGHTERDAVNPGYEGKVYPGIPRWRATLVATARVSELSSLTLGARYSGQQFNALDNSDVNYTTYTSNSPYTVVDLRFLTDLGHGFKASVGIDNLFDRTYFAYHPMSQRTVHAELKYRH